MNLEYICRTPNYLTQFQWTTAQPTGTTLQSFHIRMPVWSIAVNEGERYHFTHQGWISTMFQYWMATMVFDFDVFCTQFHNGKLRFGIVPGLYTGGNAVEFDDTNSIVVSFGANTSHQVVCPRAAAQQWLLTDSSNPSATPYNSVGTLVVRVEVPLQTASDLVGNSCMITAFLSAKDARFAVPDQVDYRFYIPENSNRVQVQNDIYTTDSNINRMDIQSESSGINTDAKRNDKASLETTAGEWVTSLKQLALAYSNGIVVDVPNGSGVLFEPFHTAYEDSQYQDHIDWIMGGYAFRKGGMRVRVLPLSIENQFLYSNSVIDPFRKNFNRLAVSISNSSVRTRKQPIVSYLEGVADFTLPYYQPTHMVRNLDYKDNIFSGFDSPVFNGIYFYAEGTSKFEFMRSVADDFSMGFLIGLLSLIHI